MSKHINRSGGKFSNSHSTLIPIAALAADIADSCESVKKIAVGIICNTTGKSSGQRKVKIIDIDGGILLLVCEGSIHQEVRVYANDMQIAKHHIARGVRDAKISIAFGCRLKHKPTG